MADKKISQLTAASTPLAGTEVLPIVQSGATVKIAISDVTAGRAVSGTQFTASTGNFIIGTAGKGIDFSVNTGTAGMTSELLSSYEEGTFTPVFTNLTINSGTPTATGKYTKVGRFVYVNILLATGSSTATANSTYCTMPFTASGDHVCYATNNGTVADYGNGLVQSNKFFMPTWAAQTNVVIAGAFIV